MKKIYLKLNIVKNAVYNSTMQEKCIFKIHVICRILCIIILTNIIKWYGCNNINYYSGQQ